MKVEIVFCSASTPKKCKDVTTVYTKSELLCIEYESGLIVKYPLCNVFSISHQHKNHLGTTKEK